jgi:hypothetical protein
LPGFQTRLELGELSAAYGQAFAVPTHPDAITTVRLPLESLDVRCRYEQVPMGANEGGCELGLEVAQ